MPDSAGRFLLGHPDNQRQPLGLTRWFNHMENIASRAFGVKQERRSNGKQSPRGPGGQSRAWLRLRGHRRPVIYDRIRVLPVGSGTSQKRWKRSLNVKPQNFERKREKIAAAFAALRESHPERLEKRLNLSWSNWGFGVEPLAESVKRLSANEIQFIELHGNHYGPDLGYRLKETRAILHDAGIRVSGICGMFSADNDLASNRAVRRQRAIDYIRREAEFGEEIGASYLLVVPAAVGRPAAYDSTEFKRSVEGMQIAADSFVKHKIRAAVEPIRSAEVSIVHTVSDAKRYITAVNHPGVRHINGDVYHMQSEESHIGEAILEAGSMLTNLHLADSNRTALGEGSLDLDAIIMALYLIGYNEEGRFCTPEPLGPGGDPYPAMYGEPDPRSLDRMVEQTARYFREREAELVGR